MDGGPAAIRAAKNPIKPYTLCGFDYSQAEDLA
jgi:hypothetical protein